MSDTTTGINARKGDVLLMVGTTKGAFLFKSKGRKRWVMDGPHFPGEEVYALAMDKRGKKPVLWAASGSPFFGTTLRRSTDMGATWSDKDAHPVKFPEGSELSLKRIWQIRPGRANEPQSIYLGVEPSCLFESDDGGASFAPVSGLLQHEHRSKWHPGAGGLCLHTVLLDPESSERTLVAMSTGGVYRTEDGGETWRPRNQGVRADFQPEKYPEFGQCVHKVVHHPSRPGRLFMQNHGGLYRSDNWGDSWSDIAKGVPSDFGFAMAMHPHDPNTVYVIPMDGFREKGDPQEAPPTCCAEGKLRVYRTRDAGESWEAMTNGLPQENVYETVLRDGMDTDDHEAAGVYFGTRSGKVYASADNGGSWKLVRDGLPPVVCVKAAVVA
jgi:photosystem II stability/assembly factor-like uncharacterized protein